MSATSATPISATAIRATKSAQRRRRLCQQPDLGRPVRDVAFSDLNEDVYAGGVDLAYRIQRRLPDDAVGRLRL
jgi:hypothetical protein